MPNPKGPLRRIDEAHMAQLDEPGRRYYEAAVRKMDAIAPPFWIALRDLWCRWRHTGKGLHYGVIPYGTWRCKVCDDLYGIKWKP